MKEFPEKLALPVQSEAGLTATMYMFVHLVDLHVEKDYK